MAEQAVLARAFVLVLAGDGNRGKDICVYSLFRCVYAVAYAQSLVPLAFQAAARIRTHTSMNAVGQHVSETKLTSQLESLVDMFHSLSDDKTRYTRRVVAST
jgi:hypothetical protein